MNHEKKNNNVHISESDSISASEMKRAQKYTSEKTLESEQESECELEREFAASPEWNAFGKTLCAVHDVIYVAPKKSPANVFHANDVSVQVLPQKETVAGGGTRYISRARRFAVGGSAAALLALSVLGVLIFVSNSENVVTPPETALAEEPECGWDADDEELDSMYQLCDRVESDDMFVDMEIAALDDSFNQWISDSDEDLF